jgi:hypothetical protein
MIGWRSRKPSGTVNLAAERGVEVEVYKRGDVQNAFRVVEARSREEIARAVARTVPGLAKYLPQKRKDWIGEDRRLSVFCAAALVLTHYHFDAMQFFDDLKQAGSCTNSSMNTAGARRSLAS